MPNIIVDATAPPADTGDGELVRERSFDRHLRNEQGDKPVEVKKEGGSYALYLRLPFAEKDRIQVYAKGDELVVQVDNQRRHLVLPRTLAGRSVASAAFTDQRLRVTFGSKEAS